MSARTKRWLTVLGAFNAVNFVSVFIVGASREWLHAGIHLMLLPPGVWQMRRVWMRARKASAVAGA